MFLLRFFKLGIIVCLAAFFFFIFYYFFFYADISSRASNEMRVGDLAVILPVGCGGKWSILDAG